MAKIFLSYVQEDSDVAREIADGLEESGYTVWYYGRDSLPGQSYVDQILEVIEQAEAVVVILSPATLGSPQVNIEISRAHSAGKPFAPLLHGGLSLSTLRGRQGSWAMMFGTAVAAPIPEEGVAAILPRLVRGLQSLGVEPSADGDPDEFRPPPKPKREERELPSLEPKLDEATERPRPRPKPIEPPSPPSPVVTETKTQGANAAVVLGYVFAVLSLVVLPIVFAPIGIGFGIYNVVKGHTTHGVAQIVLSVVLGVISTIIGAMLMGA